MRHAPCLALFAALAIAGCSSPSVSAIETVLGTAAPMGALSALAMRAVAGEDIACATTSSSCGAFPCANDVTIVVGETCPLPVGEGLAGTALVSGAWSDDRTAVLALDVSGIEGLRFDEAIGLIVDRDDDGVDVLWAMEGVDVESEDVDQSAVSVRVRFGETLALEDDVIEVSGAQQVVTDERVTQVTLADVVFTPACTLNPTAGEAVMQDVDTEAADVEVVILSFHEACDGTADRSLVAEAEIPLVDGTVPLALTE